MNKYYSSLILDQYKYYIPPNKRVIEVGRAEKPIFSTLGPEKDHFYFNTGKTFTADLSGTYDHVILRHVLSELDDVQDLLTNLKKYCSHDTRVIIEFHTYFWQLIFRGMERIGLRRSRKLQNWLTTNDIYNFLALTGYEPVKIDRKILFPKYIPWLSTFINRIIANLPLINAFAFNYFIVARPIFPRNEEFSSTILIPCRNEKGNIENAILRTPVFGKKQEFIFVEGNSQDGTYEEVQRIIEKYKDKDIKLYKQTGKGKGDAVRLGFSKAQGDILMILDADLTVPPEDLPKFYDALRNNNGEFINGCRLVYPMEKQAMRFLNLIANKFFGSFFSWLLGQKFRDTLCGTKVLFRAHYEELVANRSYFGDFDPFGDFDLIFGASKLNLKIIELPIRYKDRQYGETQIQRFRHGLLLFQMCWFAMKKIKFR